MDIEGQYQIDAPPERVWQDLNDPEVLQICIPGCESLEQIDEQRFECAITAKYGPVKARFKSRLTIEERTPPSSYVLTGEGKGGAAGFGQGRAHVQLQHHGEGTLLTYAAQFTFGGKLARLGARLMMSKTRKLCDSFFSAFSARFDAPTVERPCDQ